MTASDPGAVRVLSLIKGLGPGGAEQLLLLTTTVTDPERVTHRVAYLRRDKTHLVPEFESRGIVPVRLGAGSGRLGMLRELRFEISQAQVVHVHSPVPAAIARVVARTLPRSRRPPVVSTEHNEWTSHRWPTRLANALTTGLDTQHWAVSDQVRATVWRPWRGGYQVLVHGIDTTAAAPEPGDRPRLRAELAVGEDELLVVTVANLRRNKDYPNLLRAARIALDSEPRLRFAAIGQGPLTHEITALRDDLGLSERFALLGFRRDVPHVLAAADLFVLASAHEGLPVAVMEAFVAGLPVVATGVGGLPGQVREGIEGRIVPPGDPAALAQALVTLAQEEDKRLRMARAARARATDYDIRRAVRELNAAYEELARRRRRH